LVWLYITKVEKCGIFALLFSAFVFVRPGVQSIEQKSAALYQRNVAPFHNLAFRCPEAEPLAGAVVTQLPSCHAEPATLEESI